MEWKEVPLGREKDTPLPVGDPEEGARTRPPPARAKEGERELLVGGGGWEKEGRDMEALREGEAKERENPRVAGEEDALGGRVPSSTPPPPLPPLTFQFFPRAASSALAMAEEFDAGGEEPCCCCRLR